MRTILKSRTRPVDTRIWSPGRMSHPWLASPLYEDRHRARNSQQLQQGAVEARKNRKEAIIVRLTLWRWTTQTAAGVTGEREKAHKHTSPAATKETSTHPQTAAGSWRKREKSTEGGNSCAGSRGGYAPPFEGVPTTLRVWTTK